MSRGARYSCPVHGFTDCHAMSDGFYCLGDGAGPDDVCGLKCDFPMQMEDGRIYRTPAELLAGERTDPGPGKAFPRRGRGIVVKQRPRQKAANGPPVRRGAPRPRTTNHETPAEHAPTCAAPAKEEDVPREKTIQCEQCLAPMDQAKPGQKRCRGCIAKIPSAIWCGFKNECPGDLAAARAKAAAYTPRRRGKAPEIPKATAPAPAGVPEKRASGNGYDPDIEKVAARPKAESLVERVVRLERAVLDLAADHATVAELRRVVLGEGA